MSGSRTLGAFFWFKRLASSSGKEVKQQLHNARHGGHARLALTMAYRWMT
jgi:hypothetical protein